MTRMAEWLRHWTNVLVGSNPSPGRVSLYKPYKTYLIKIDLFITNFDKLLHKNHSNNLLINDQDGRVVKALDLKSNGLMSSWIQTPLLVV